MVSSFPLPDGGLVNPEPFRERGLREPETPSRKRESSREVEGGIGSCERETSQEIEYGGHVPNGRLGASQLPVSNGRNVDPDAPRHVLLAQPKVQSPLPEPPSEGVWIL